MQAFLKKHRVLIISTCLILFSLHLSLGNKKGAAGGAFFRDATLLVVSPVQTAILDTYNAAAAIVGDYLLLISVNRENVVLKNALTELEAENNRLREEARQSERLRDVLEYREAAAYSTTAAEVVGMSSGSWTRTATINKGTGDGVTKDMSVLTPRGAAGKVIDAGSKTSTVLLLTDLRSAVDVVVQRTRIKGVAEGNGADAVVIKYIRQLDDVQVGDVVVTSGLAGVFPKGLAVGEVVKVEKGKDNFFKHVEVRPAVDFNRIEDVLVVTDFDQDGE